MTRCLASFWVVALATGALAEGEIVDGIAAQVGSEIVLVSDVTQVAAPAEAQVRRAGGDDAEVARLHSEVLERLIERALIRGVVRRAELEATEAEVDQAIEAIAGENGITMEQLLESVETQGLPFDAYRERIRGEIEQSKVLSGLVASRVRLEEREIRALYDKEFAHQPTGGTEVHLRHVVVPSDPEDPSTQRSSCNKVRRALARVRSGEPFEKVASEVSEANPREGGDIGWLHEKNLASWMAEPVATLEEGQTSEVIETSFGCNLLHLVERRPYEHVDYEEARDVLRTRLFNERMAEEYTSFVGELRERTYIERKGVFSEATRLDSGAAANGESREF